MTRLFAALLAATVAALAVAAGWAGADTLSFRSGSFTAASNGALTFEGGGRRATCNLTLSGSFYARTIEATRGTSLADVTRASTSACSGVTLLGPSAERPWQLKYDSIGGAMPDAIEGLNVRLSGFAAGLEAFGIGCLYSGEPGASTVLTRVAEAVGSFDFRNIRFTTNSQSRVSGEALCPASTSVTGSLELQSQWRVTSGTNPQIQWNIGTPPPIYFGFQRILEGARWYSIEVEFRNTSTTTNITVREIRITQGNTERFRTANIAANDVILANGGTKRFQIAFNPTQAGTLTAWVEITAADGHVYAMSLRGDGH